jgi:hypothetical protein
MSSSAFQCSPALHRRDGETCLPPQTLERLRRVWNRTHPRNKITANTATRKKGKAAGTTQPPLWSKLREAMKTHYQCDTEFCMVKKMDLPKAEKASLLSYFRPEKPDEWDSKPTQWLDSFNIEDVMNQYEQADPSFEFIGPVPIDFDEKTNAWGKCIVDELCKLDLPAVAKKGTQKIGIIFNLDKHDEPGSHWVCAFVDIPGKAAYYFDSYGYEPQNEIVRFLNRCMEQGCDKIVYNDIRHQRKGSECGMYCLIVIICLLQKRAFYDICKNIIPDDLANAFRDILYAEEKPRKASIDIALKKLCL